MQIETEYEPPIKIGIELVWDLNRSGEMELETVS